MAAEVFSCVGTLNKHLFERLRVGANPGCYVYGPGLEAGLTPYAEPVTTESWEGYSKPNTQINMSSGVANVVCKRRLGTGDWAAARAVVDYTACSVACPVAHSSHWHT